MSNENPREVYYSVDGQEDDPAVVALRDYVESLGGTEWARYFYPHLFDRPFTQYQIDYWQWIDLIEQFQYYRPRVECEPRGVGKSTNAEASVVKLVATGMKKMIGYVSLNEDKAGKHFANIKAMFESSKLQRIYPGCSPKVQKLQNKAAQWSREAIVCQNGAMIVPLTLLGSSRGWKSEDGYRFDLIVLDDIDALGQSPEFTKKLIELLKGEILAAGDDNTLVIMPQNLIYRDSICSQIYDYRADIMTNRDFRGPYPLLKGDYEAEKVELPGGGREWRITKAEPFDPAIPVSYAEKLLNLYGKQTFDRECQQKVFEIEEDKDFREWNEQFHIITVSEFRRKMEELGEPVWNEQRNCLQIPPRWNVGLGLDWGTTRKHPSVTTFSAKPAENSPLKDCQFMFGEICKPKFPLDSFESPEIVSVGRVATAIREFLDLWNVRDSQVVLRLMSHEASAALNTMAVDLPEETAQFFNKWKAEKGSGVPQIQNLLEINPNKSHPFRRYPNGYKINDIDYSGLPLRGSPKIFFIVPDDQGALRIDVTGQLFVMGAKNALGFARARFEIPIYSFRNQGDNTIDDDFCFVAGTEILTSDGLKPIEKITTNDKVLTRKGWRKVLNCGVTNENAKTFTLTTLDGKKLTGTGNHPIFTSRGVVALRGLAKNDKIYVWKKKSSSTKTLNFIGIPKQNNRRTENIFNRIFTPERKEFLISTLKYGKTILAKFQKDITSTIKTTITTIIQSKTLNVCPAINILPNINQAFPNVVNHQNIWNILKKSEKKLPNGINLPKGRNGTKNTESSFGKTKNLLPEIVTSAELNINQLDKEQDFVQIVADGVLMIEENEQRVKVFNLKVEDCPEYFANGILVHNCDAWRGLENVFGVPSQGKTHEEKVEDKMPDPVKQENLDREFEDPHEKDMLMQRRAIEEKRINRDLKKPILPPGMAKFRRR
jgi:hypothetical protein